MFLIRDIGCDCDCELDIAFGEATDYAREEEGAEIGGADPEEDAEDVAGHAEEEGCSAAVAVGEGADYGGCEGLEKAAKH